MSPMQVTRRPSSGDPLDDFIQFNVCSRGGEAVEITQEHKPSNPIEKERLETSKTPVWITNDKVRCT